jgi:DNA mismatch repair ATPase MutL
MNPSASLKSIVLTSFLLLVTAVAPVVAQQQAPLPGNQGQATNTGSNQNSSDQPAPTKAPAPSVQNNSARETEEKRLSERRAEREAEERAERERYNKREDAEKRSKDFSQHETNLRTKDAQGPAELNELESPFEKSSQPADIVIDGKKLLTIGAWLGPFSPEARVDAIEKRVIGLASEWDYDPQTIKVVDTAYTSDINSGKGVIMSVSNADAHFAGAVWPTNT